MILRAVPGLSAESPEVLLALAERFDVQLPQDSWICREGDPSSALYLLAEGHVEVYKRGRSSASSRVATLEPGAIFGHVGVLSGGARTAGLKAVGQVVLMVMPARQVHHILDREHTPAASALRRALIVAYIRQIRAATRLLARLSAAAG